MTGAKKEPHFVVYMCTYCGNRTTRNIKMGHPQPGRCSRKNGGPHHWIKDRTY